MNVAQIFNLPFRLPRFIPSVVALLCLTATSLAQLATPSQQFQEAIHLMETKGDYAGAIKRFEAIAQGNDRPLAARALLQLGFCYEKVGNAIARDKYQQLIDQFSGFQNAEIQQIISQARNRVTALDSARSLSRSDLVTRRVWAKAGGYSDSGGLLAIAVSPDGRYLAMSFPRAGTSELIRFEVATGEKRILTPATPEDDAVSGGSSSAIFSRDGRQIAFDWHSAGGYDLQLIDVDGTNRRRLYKSETVNFINPVDWSSDGRYLLTVLNRKGSKSPDLVLLNVVDGSERILKTFPHEPSNPALSPDGRYVVYDWPQAGELPTRHDLSRHHIHLLDTRTGQITPLVENPADDFVLGWAPDGKRILFASDRTGNVDAWLLSAAEGKPQGQPQLVKRDLGQIRRIGLTRNGALFYRVHSGLTDVWIAKLDPVTEKVLPQPTLASPNYVGFNRSGAWSRDGRYLAYLAARDRHLREPFGQPYLVIRSTDTGDERVLEPRMNWLNHLRLAWSPDGRSILVTGHDKKDQMGVFQIDVQSGDVVLVHTEPKTWFYQAVWSLDGKSIFYNSSEDTTKAFHLQTLDLASRRVRDLFSPDPEESYVWRFDLSADGRQIVFLHLYYKGEVNRMKVIPVEGGEARDIYVFPKGEVSIDVAWTADGRHILFNKLSDEQDMLCRISADGGEPENLGIEVGRLPHIQCHPDGRQIGFTVTKGQNEVWVMENFLPTLNASQ